MINLFKQKSKAVRAYRVENLNPEKGISASLRVSQNEYTVCLCLSSRTIKTVFRSEWSALEQLHKYRQLYKKVK